METLHTQLNRLHFTSEKCFDDVLNRLYRGIKRPNSSKLNATLRSATSLLELEADFDAFVANSDLMEFQCLDLAAAFGLRPSCLPYRMLRLSMGNPLIIGRLVQCMPEAGSSLPVTVFLYETEHCTHLWYDTASSLLAASDNHEAHRAAADLDKSVIDLILNAVT